MSGHRRKTGHVYLITALLAAVLLLAMISPASLLAQSTAELSVPQTRLRLGGWAAPRAQILVAEADSESVVGATAADKHGRFELTLHSLEPGLANYTVTSIDADGTTTPQVKANISIAPQRTTYHELILPSALKRHDKAVLAIKHPLSDSGSLLQWQLGAFVSVAAALGLAAGSLKSALVGSRHKL